MDNSLGRTQAGTLETLGKRAVAYLVLIAVALIALKIIGGVVIGLVTTLLTVAVVVALIFAAVWAFRRL
jgi:hypothetical protein